MNIKHNIDKLFNQGLSNHTDTPPDFIWHNINDELKTIKSKKSKKIAYGVAASIALLLSFSSGYFISKINKIDTTVVDMENRAITNYKQTSFKEQQTPELQKVACNREAVYNKNKQIVINKDTISNSNFTEKEDIIETKKEKSKSILLAENSMSKGAQLSKKDYNIDVQPTVSDFLISKSKIKRQLWSVGMTAAPLISYRTITNKTQANKTIEKPLTSYSIGVNVGYKVSKRWKIQSGIYMSELGQTSSNVAINKQPHRTVANKNTYNINTSAGNIQIQDNNDELINKLTENTKKPIRSNTNSLESNINADFVQSFEYLEIPVLINYKIIDKKMSMSISGGLSTNFMYNSATYIKSNNTYQNIDSKYNNLKNINYSGVVGIELEYPIITRLNFNLQPTLRYSLNSITNTQKVYPYSFGFYTGLRYNF